MAMPRVMGDEPGHGQALGQVCCAGRDGLGSTSSLEALKALSAGHRTICVCAAERLEGSKIAWLRPTRKLDVDSSAASAVVDVSSADGRQQCPPNGWQRTLSSYGRLNPTGSGRQPSGIKHANQQSVARCNLRNRTNRRSRQCVGLERAMICTAPWKAKRVARRACAARDSALQ